jgi:phasin family protein
MDRFAKHLKNPFASATELLEKVNFAGFDAAGLVEARRKDIEAILEANRIVYAGAQALAQKQFEILRMTMTAARAAVAEGSFSGSPMEIANRQRTMMAKAFQMSLKHMHELAEIVRKAQADAFSVVKQQVRQDIGELVGGARKKAAPKAAPAAKAKRTAKAKAARKPQAKAKARPATAVPAKRAAKPATKPARKPAAKRVTKAAPKVAASKAKPAAKRAATPRSKSVAPAEPVTE